MDNPQPDQKFTWPRVALFAFLAVVMVMGAVLVVRLTGLPPSSTISGARVNVLTNSTDSCVSCHRKASPGIIEQFGHSSMAAAKVACTDCHQVAADYPGAIEHEGTNILSSPTTARCEHCHQEEVIQYNASRHSLPSYVAVFGSKDLPDNLMALYKSIPEGQFAPDKSRNAIGDLEGPDITRFACETCHDVGKPAVDGSVGQCQKCHLRHEFSLEQARKPETCNGCHIGPDHPQWEIYEESPHGVSYMTGGDDWNWEAESGSQQVKDFPAPTCATCHFSGFGGAVTTHDVGARLSWFLFAPISERRPAWQDNMVRMQSVCLECHNKNFVQNFYVDADKEVVAVNAFIKQSNDIMQPLKDQKLVTDAPFDEPIEYTYFEVWHHWGRTAKFGAWMQGPDYTQWHGAYEIIKGLAELREQADQKLKAAEK